RAAFRSQRRRGDDALAVHDGAVFVHFDCRLELVRRFDELRRRPDVHPERGHDLGVALDYCHINPTTSATADSPSATRRPFNRSLRQRNARNTSPAVTTAASWPQRGNGTSRKRADSVSAKPTENADW